jgi:formylglycine-generating enzyme required for sulfatase activity
MPPLKAKQAYPAADNVSSSAPQSKRCFVIMPFGEQGTDKYERNISIYQDMIKPVVEECGYISIRADELEHMGSITRDIIEHLHESDLVVADLSDHNANVFYELGVRHALYCSGTIPIIRKGELLPFDIANYKTLFYSIELKGPEIFRNSLKRRIKAFEKFSMGKSDNPVHDILGDKLLNQEKLNKALRENDRLKREQEARNNQLKSIAKEKEALEKALEEKAGLEKRIEELEEELERTKAAQIRVEPTESSRDKPLNQKPEEVITNYPDMKFVYIPPGTFMMGSPPEEKGRYDRETLHEVTLTKGFYLQTTQVTQAQWKAVMGNNPSRFQGCDDCPVETVFWNDVQDFIRKLNQREGKDIYRLPTEAEWEYTARAGSTTGYCFGDDESLLSEYAWYDKNSENKTHPVATRKPNAWGLYDMHGNVWEWCEDRYGDYPSGKVTDPVGTSDGSFRVLRGGGWFSMSP